MVINVYIDLLISILNKRFDIYIYINLTVIKLIFTQTLP